MEGEQADPPFLPLLAGAVKPSRRKQHRTPCGAAAGRRVAGQAWRGQGRMPAQLTDILARAASEASLFLYTAADGGIVVTSPDGLEWLSSKGLPAPPVVCSIPGQLDRYLRTSFDGWARSG